ncbi:response regulator receiver domain [Flavobacterium cellulosilyticum]|uniref:Response receiver domain-containing protein n=1 Tax=Flavobacterium cellulosilyticum TaxID=2541731 RepID=A0A4R5CBT3_9FLAO|nr:response regulator receiver domain [Flavobacterium cellulosilyticum]TDD94552.1 hypothetical protein E0F76_16160 [Flavobacterium cellulosilyticum]
MSNPFFEKSKEIANNFLQSIVFIDDKAYSGVTEDDPNHDFDAQKVSMAFATEKKICGVYQPKTKLDIENFKSIVKKADVVILDWKIILSEDEIEDPNADDDDDPRGIYTLDILKNIFLDISNNKESLKLIVVYTGEIDLNEITSQIFDELIGLKPDLIKESCEVSSNNIKILIRAKSSVEDDEVDNKFNHLVGLNDKIVKYRDLPNFVLDEFTTMTSGLLSNFALLSLTTLRENSSKLLGLFNIDLDSAYLGHKSVLPNQNDSELLLIELFASSLIDILKYKNIDDFIQVELLESYIDTIPDLNLGKFIRNNTLLKELLSSKIEDVNKRYETLLPDSLNKKEKLSFSKDSTKLFIDKNEEDYIFKINKEFARLTHHKNIFLPSTTLPKLNLGTIIRSIQNNQQYYVCIQQRCDSVRIIRDSERKFLFIPLNVVIDKPFNILTTEGVKLKVESKSFSLRTIKFISENSNGVVEAVIQDGKFIFIQKYRDTSDEQFEWVLDLKDLHAQRIVAEYASTLSRVGLDESEWLRNSAK